MSELTFVGIDFETANRHRWSACAVGLAVVRGGLVLQTLRRFIRPPERWFDERAIALHGITAQCVASAPEFPQVWQELQRFVDGELLVAHNARFDRAILEDCFRYYGIEPSAHRFACSLTLARRAWSERPVRLPDVCGRLGFPLRHHDPESDAEGAAWIALAAADRLGIAETAGLLRPPRRPRSRRRAGR